MVTTGEKAPAFELPGVHAGERGVYQLDECLDLGGVLLAFYPCDFSPLCKEKLCTIRDVEWFDFQDGFTVLGISRDSLYAHEEFIERNDIPFPLLSDTDGRVTAAYGVQYDHWEGQPGLPRRAFVVIDRHGIVRYRAVVADANEVPDFDPLLNAVRQLSPVESA